MGRKVVFGSTAVKSKAYSVNNNYCLAASCSSHKYADVSPTALSLDATDSNLTSDKLSLLTSPCYTGTLNHMTILASHVGNEITE